MLKHECGSNQSDHLEIIMDEAHFTRVCTSCKTEFPATSEYFHAYKRAPDGCRAVCRACRAADHAAHRDDRMLKRRDHYQANKERLNKASRAFYQKNIEAQRAAGLARHYRNRDKRIKQMQAYRESNLDEINARRRPKNRMAFHERYGVDVGFTLKHRLRALMRATLTNGRDGLRMREILGYGADELKAHLERQFSNGMTWERFLSGEIHIDHILPVAHFKIDGAGSSDFKYCWSLSNLRPMWAKDNLSKGAKVLTLV